MAKERSAAYVLFRVFEIKTVLGVPWNLQFAGPAFVETGAALVVERDEFGFWVGRRT